VREKRSDDDAPLAMEPERFRELGHVLVDDIADLLGTMPERPVSTADGPDDVRARLPKGGLPEAGEDAGVLLRDAARVMLAASTLNGHPRFFGYITASPAPIGILGDFLASALNPNVGGWSLSPTATEIERQTVSWIAELIGYPSDAGGLLVSGGNVANFTCFLAARTAAAPWPVRSEGLATAASRPLVVYASAETHTWIQKAADLFGLGTDAIRWIPTDAAQRMDVAQLRATIEQDLARGRRPMMVVGTAGSVSTGAVDPLREIADVCGQRGVWFHIDGAYGGFAAAAAGAGHIDADAAAELQAFARADSIAVDPHKWLYAPLEAGCALVRGAVALRNAFSYHPPYYHFGVEATNYVDYGLQNSRGFRALKVWLALRQAGRSGYARSIGDDIALAQHLYAQVSRHAELEPFTCALSICTFRYVPAHLRQAARDAATEATIDAINRELLDRLQKGGDAFISNAVVRERYVLRACIVNFNTTRSDVEALPEIVARVGREVARELQVTA
jgi:aromatic-L-amino-acid/L-tryptophan decarboxylase